MEEVKISVIIPNYNSIDFIEETLQSLINQTFKDFEVVVVDDGSTDGSFVYLVNRANEFSNLIVLSRSHDQQKGGASCRNIGINHSRGKYIIFLDADDCIAPWCLEERIKAIEDTENDFIVFPTVRFFKEMGDSDVLINNVDLEEPDLEAFIRLNFPWHTSGPIWEKKYLNKINGFDIFAKNMQDWELHIRALLKDPIYYKANTLPDVFYRKHVSNSRVSNNVSRDTIKSRKSLILRILEAIKQSKANNSHNVRLLAEVYINHCLYYLSVNKDDKPEDLTLVEKSFDIKVQWLLKLYVFLIKMSVPNAMLNLIRRGIRYKMFHSFSPWRGTFGSVYLSNEDYRLLTEKLGSNE